MWHEHPDTLETIEKELKIIAEYDDELQMLDKYFITKDPFKKLMSEQPQLFETEDQYGNDIIQGPKLPKKT